MTFTADWSVFDIDLLCVTFLVVSGVDGMFYRIKVTLLESLFCWPYTETVARCQKYRNKETRMHQLCRKNILCLTSTILPAICVFFFCNGDCIKCGPRFERRHVLSSMLRTSSRIGAVMMYPLYCLRSLKFRGRQFAPVDRTSRPSHCCWWWVSFQNPQPR